MSPDKKPGKPVDVYVRVSQVGGRDVEAEGGTAASQEKRCRSYLAAQDMKVGKVFKDLDQSGGKLSRPAFDEALKRAREGISGGFIVINLKRFGRRAKAAELIIELEQKHGATVIAIEDNLDTSTPMGRAMVRFIATLAELELEQLTEGWDRTQTRRIDAGIHSGVPLGYARGEDERLVVNGYADVVREVFAARASGMPWGEVARMLTAAGAPTRFKDKKSGELRTIWTESGARALIRNDAYIGTARYGKDKVHENAHPALVDEVTFRAANRTKPRKATRGPGEGKLLTGIVFCASCGYRMSYCVTTSNGRHYEFLRCQGSRDCPGRATISKDKLEPYVIEAALAHLGPIPEYVDKSSKERNEAEAAFGAAYDELAALERDLESGEITARAFALASSAVERAKDAALDRLAELGEEGAVPTITVTREEFDALPLPKRREVLREIVTRITISRGKGGAEERVELELDPLVGG
jgi:DNA invertase Pin-like site-specific DNA recombinase